MERRLTRTVVSLLASRTAREGQGQGWYTICIWKLDETPLRTQLIAEYHRLLDDDRVEGALP